MSILVIEYTYPFKAVLSALIIIFFYSEETDDRRLGLIYVYWFSRMDETLFQVFYFICIPPQSFRSYIRCTTEKRFDFNQKQIQ